MMRDIVTNTICAAGVAADEPTHSHCVYGEDFYAFFLEVERLSGAFDILPCVIPERLKGLVRQGERIEVYGQIRSYNRIVDGANRLEIKVFVREVFPAEEETCLNDAMLCGFICKPPVYRVTPFGREITDMLLAVNRAYNKSDYIPVIAWGRNARLCSKFEVGERICVHGRLQSREYEKVSRGETLVRTAYELSACAVELITQNDESSE